MVELSTPPLIATTILSDICKTPNLTDDQNRGETQSDFLNRHFLTDDRLAEYRAASGVGRDLSLSLRSGVQRHVPNALNHFGKQIEDYVDLLTRGIAREAEANAVECLVVA